MKKIKRFKLKTLSLFLLLIMSCSTTPEQDTISFTCKHGHKLTCPKNKCEEYCRKYESYDDPYMIKTEGDSDNPFILDNTQEQVIFGHGN